MILRKTRDASGASRLYEITYRLEAVFADEIGEIRWGLST